MSRRLTLILGATLALAALAAPLAASDAEVFAPEPLATVIEPDPTVVDARPHAWDHVLIRSDGHTLDIYFWMGIEECNGLHSVTVTPTETGIDVLLMSGQPADMEPDTACIEIAQLYVTTVTLDDPLIGNAG